MSNGLMSRAVRAVICTVGALAVVSTLLALWVRSSPDPSGGANDLRPGASPVGTSPLETLLLALTGWERRLHYAEPGR